MKMSLALCMVLIFCLTTTAFAQDFQATKLNQTGNLYTFDFLGGGARTHGMGSAYIAVSDDISGISCNPAGLYQMEVPILGFSYGSFLPRGTYTTPKMELDQTSSFNNVRMVSFLAPIRVKGHQFVSSMSYTRESDDFTSSGQDTTVVLTNRNGHDNNYTSTANYEGNTGLYTLNLGFGTRIYNDVSFGIAANIYTGKSESRADQLISQDAFVELVYSQEVLWQEFNTVIDTNKFSGVNFSIGLKYNTDNFNAGLLLKTPFELNIETGQSIYHITKMNGLTQTNYTDTIYTENLLTKVEIPWYIGLGFSYKWSEDFIGAVDFEYRGFKNKIIKNRTLMTILPGGDIEEEFAIVDPMWKNSIAVRLGTEYKFKFENDIFPEVPVRAGFGIAQIPGFNREADGSFSQPSRFSFSLGTGIYWTQIHLDMAYRYDSIDLEDNLNNAGLRLENRSHQLELTFTGYFE